ncbi:hypothetical protein AAFF89_003274, partial [Providencia stuartii]|nr:hypothetical protein [Providencia stuartii]
EKATRWVAFLRLGDVIPFYHPSALLSLPTPSTALPCQSCTSEPHIDSQYIE